MARRTVSLSVSELTFQTFISVIRPLVISLNAKPCGRFVSSMASHH